MTILVFGYGFIGAAFAEAIRADGHAMIATARDAEKRRQLAAHGVAVVDPANAPALEAAVAKATAILVTPPPGDDGCPAFSVVGHLDLGHAWIGYLSTTGVYGDRGGGWVFEDSALLPTSDEGKRRVAAENQWLTKNAHIFRLPGLYGPGRNVLTRLRDGTARRVHKPGHVFSRLHHDDCAGALRLSLAKPGRGAIYNLCDDAPAPADEVLAWAAREFGLPLPPEMPLEDVAADSAMRRFYRDNKRVSNARAKAELGWRLLYPSYREGLRAIHDAIP